MKSRGLLSSIVVLMLASAAEAQLVLSPDDPAPDRYPVLIQDETGGNLTGFFHRHVAIYSDGLVSFSVTGLRVPCVPEHDDFPTTLAVLGPAPLCDVVDAVHVPREAVEALSLDLRRLGIGRIRGGQPPGLVPDRPLRAVTWFRPRFRRGELRFGPRARATSFSYFIATDEIEPIEERIAEFLDEYVR